MATYTVNFPLTDSNGDPQAGGTGTVRVLDVDSRELLDPADSTFKAVVAAPEFALTDDAGNYYKTFTVTGWGTRNIQFLAAISAPSGDIVNSTHSVVIIGGSPAAPVYAPTPPSGSVSVVYYVRTSTGEIPGTAPTGTLYVVRAAENPSAQSTAQAGAWDGVAGALSWSVPENTPAFLVVCPSTGLYRYIASTTSQVVVNTATSIG